MSEYITGSRDTDFELLMKLSDHELGVVCQTNKKVRAVCENDYFWKRRAVKFYNISELVFNKLKDFLEFTDNKSFYIYLKDKTPELENYSTSILEGIDYDQDLITKINNITVPEYVDKQKFIRYLKRKIFENISYTTEYIFSSEYSISYDILSDFTSIFKDLNFAHPRVFRF